MVAGLCVLWFAYPAGAAPLESWDNQIPNAHLRFKVLSEFANQAVLDKETQLVWERSPGSPAIIPDTWIGSRISCANKSVGGRKGWRMPSMPELASLIDPTALNPALPAGHPFSGVESAHYWSATTNAASPDFAWYVAFYTGGVADADKRNATIYTWCVRGGMNADQY